MHFVLQGKSQKEVYVAFSGGVDSVAVAHFMSACKDVTLIHVVHQNDTASEKEVPFVTTFANEHSLKLEIIEATLPRGKHESLKEYWRNSRYDVLHKLQKPVVTAHNLDDCVETWVWSSLHGEGKLIPYANQNVIRPFLLNRKAAFVNYVKIKNLNWCEDASNTDTSFTRNFIRHEMMPNILKVNPGIHTTIRNKLLER